MSIGNNKTALLIGIEYLGTSNELLGCATDVKNMYNLLINNLGYLPKNITVLTEENGNLPTKDNILKSIDILSNECISRGIRETIIYYSGHGNQVPDWGNDEEDGLDEILVPLDYNKSGMIMDDTIHQHLKFFPVTTQTMCIFDSCNSGTIGDLQYTYYYNPLDDTTQMVKSNNKNLLENSITCISGCKDNQTSSVVLTQNGWNSALTTALIGIFSKYDREITFHQLDRDLNQYMINNNLDQRPVLSSSWEKKPGSLISLTRPTLDTNIQRRVNIPVLNNTSDNYITSENFEEMIIISQLGF